jgi:hypothetical protein
MKYLAKFVGRKVNAIGVWQVFTDYVMADNEEQARIRLYDHYEHMSQLTLEPRGEMPICGPCNLKGDKHDE